jgi:GGDEF domain-containing protein
VQSCRTYGRIGRVGGKEFALVSASPATRLAHLRSAASHASKRATSPEIAASAMRRPIAAPNL